MPWIRAGDSTWILPEDSELPPAPAPGPTDEALAALERTAPLIEYLTGVKAQYVAAGWSPAGAEQITIAAFKAQQAHR